MPHCFACSCYALNDLTLACLSLCMKGTTSLTPKFGWDGDAWVNYQFNLSPLMGMVLIPSFCRLRQ